MTKGTDEERIHRLLGLNTSLSDSFVLVCVDAEEKEEEKERTWGQIER